MNVLFSMLVVSGLCVMVASVAASLRDERRLQRRLREWRDKQDRLDALEGQLERRIDDEMQRRCLRRFLLPRRGLGAQEGRQP